MNTSLYNKWMVLVVFAATSHANADSLVGPVQYPGTGQWGGQQACPYEVKTAGDYRLGKLEGKIAKLESQKEDLEEKMYELEDKQNEIRASVDDWVKPEYKDFFLKMAEDRSCQTWTVQAGTAHLGDAFGPYQDEFDPKGTEPSYKQFCSYKAGAGTGTPSLEVLCSNRNLFVDDKVESRKCVSAQRNLKSANDAYVKLEKKLDDIEEDLSKAEGDKLDKEMRQMTTEVCATCGRDDDSEGPTVKPWQWFLGAALDIGVNYSVKRGYDRDAKYYSRLGYPPNPYRAYPGPQATMGLLNASIYGAGAGSFGCAGGWAGGGFPGGPGGMYGQYGAWGGLQFGAGYGGGAGGMPPWGYPGGYGAPGYYGFPGGVPGGGAWGGYPGAYPGGGVGLFVSAFGQGYMGGYPGSYPGGYPGGFPVGMGGAYGAGYPGGFGQGFVSAFGGGMMGAMPGGYAMGGGYMGAMPGGYAMGGGYMGAMPGGYAMGAAFPGGYAMGAAFPGGYAGGAMPGAMPGGYAGGAQWELYQRQLQVQLEFQQRYAEQQRTRQEASGRIYQQMMILQRQLMELNTGGMGGGGYLGGDFNFNIGIGGGYNWGTSPTNLGVGTGTR